VGSGRNRSRGEVVVVDEVYSRSNVIRHDDVCCLRPDTATDQRHLRNINVRPIPTGEAPASTRNQSCRIVSRYTASCGLNRSGGHSNTNPLPSSREGMSLENESRASCACEGVDNVAQTT